MPLIQLVIVLVIVGVILWVINSYIPMQATIKKILNVVVIIAVVLWLLSVFGVIGSSPGDSYWEVTSPKNPLGGTPTVRESIPCPSATPLTMISATWQRPPRVSIS